MSCLVQYLDDLNIKMNLENWEDVSEIVFSSCDPNGLGDIPVCHLIAYIQREMQKVYDRSLLQELELMLLSPPGKPEFTIGKETFGAIIKAWVSYVQELNISPRDGHCDQSQFEEIESVSHLESPCLISYEYMNYVTRQKSLEQQLSDTEKQRNNLLVENTRLETFVKENEETIQSLTVEHNNLKDSYAILDKKLKVYKEMKHDFEELEITCKNQQSIITKLESQVKCLQKDIVQLEKKNSSLQETVVNLKEERCEVVQNLENSRHLLSKAKTDIFHIKQEFEDVVTHKDSERIVLSEQVRDFENFISDLKSTIEVYKNKNLFLEEELIKLKSVQHNHEPSKNTLTPTFYGDNINNNCDSTNLLYCEAKYLRNTKNPLSLHDELLASGDVYFHQKQLVTEGDVYFHQKQLVTELQNFHQKLKICKVELIECQDSVNFMTTTLNNVTKLLKWINNNIDEYDLISEKITKVVGEQLCGSSKSLVLDFLIEIEKLSRMVSQIMKRGSYTSTNNPEQLSKTDNTTQTFYRCCTSVSKCIQSDVHCSFQILPEHILKESSWTKLYHECDCCSIADQIIKTSLRENGVSSRNTAVITLASHTTALTKCENRSDVLISSTIPDKSIMEATKENSSVFKSVCKLPLDMIKILFSCILYFNYFLGHIVKLLMLLFVSVIFYVLIMHFIFECSRPYGCGLDDIGEFLRPYIRLHHYSPPPV